MVDSESFFPAALDAGAILTGFYATFLVFRIQREAEYYRKSGDQQFSASFCLLIVGAIVTASWGVALPLLRLAQWMQVDPGIVVGGMTASAVLAMGYFLVEILHYRIIETTDQACPEQSPGEQCPDVPRRTLKCGSKTVTHTFKLRRLGFIWETTVQVQPEEGHLESAKTPAEDKPDRVRLFANVIMPCDTSPIEWRWAGLFTLLALGAWVGLGLWTVL